MEKERNTKILAIIALLIGVVGLSLGFAAFSNTLKISSSAEVTPSADTFNVDFSSSSSSLATDPVVASLNPTGVTGFEATNGTIDNSNDPTITNLHATFTAPGQKATYTFYARNIGEYIAYLKSITFANVNGETSSRICTPGTGTTASQVTAACDDISLKVTVGSETPTTSSVANITNHSLAIDGSDPITVEIEYAANGDRADGDFTVAFGDVTLTYNSVD